jgi:hypothetical protein
MFGINMWVHICCVCEDFWRIAIFCTVINIRKDVFMLPIDLMEIINNKNEHIHLLTNQLQQKTLLIQQQMD